MTLALRSIGKKVSVFAVHLALIVSAVTEVVVYAELRFLVIILKVSVAVVEAGCKGLHCSESAHISGVAPLHHEVDYGVYAAVGVSHARIVNIFNPYNFVRSKCGYVLLVSLYVVYAHLHSAASK